MNHFSLVTYTVTKRLGGIKLRSRTSKRIGLIVSSVGVGIVLTVLIPIWGWFIAIGCGVIGLGWFIMNKFC